MERQASAEEAKKLKAAQDAKLQIEGIEPRLAERGIQLQVLKDQIRPWDEQVAALEVEAAKFEAEASFADRGLDRTRVRGCGNEVCKPAKKNAAERRKKIADIEKELKPKHDDLTRVTAEIEVLQKTLSDCAGRRPIFPAGATRRARYPRQWLSTSVRDCRALRKPGASLKETRPGARSIGSRPRATYCCRQYGR
jgi:hypothetical protein